MAKINLDRTPIKVFRDVEKNNYSLDELWDARQEEYSNQKRVRVLQILYNAFEKKRKEPKHG